MIRCLSFWLLLIFAAAGTALPAQEDAVAALLARFKAAAGFDTAFPLERVYLHLDNNAYVENETLWFSAYVVRASTLQPRPLSRVLYVELLDAGGQTMERKLLRIDDSGRAWGEFELKPPVRAGFYEVRAFTREMLNWGDEAVWSRVVPVFKKSSRRKLENPMEEYAAANLLIPVVEEERSLAPGHPRPYDFGAPDDYRLTFYPEGGHRVAGVAQRIAFQLTTGNGQPLTDTVRVFTATGQLLLQTESEHEGMGVFTLPASAVQPYAEVGRGKSLRRFPLPDVVPAAAYALSARRTDEGTSVVIAPASGVSDGSVVGLAVTCRNSVCYLDTLTVTSGAVELLLPDEALHEGVNRIDLFDADGRSLASRLVWKPVAARSLEVSVRQNAESYAPFEPVALEVEVKDTEGRPVQTDLSLAVRDAESDLVRSPCGGIATDLLLSSEVRGYIPRPNYYFEADDDVRRRALDLLLMVQGWSATDFSVLSGHEPFRWTQPVEENLTLNGTVYRDNNKLQPLPGATLRFGMYSLDGASLSAEATTDSLGRFAFVSNVDFAGEWVAQFTTRDEKGKKKWSRIALDRWFAPEPRKIDIRERALTSPSYELEAAEPAAPVTFVWADTIPRTLSKALPTAVVVHRNKYRGFTGNRYSYYGGKSRVQRAATHYYNIVRETERHRDAGGGLELVWDVLARLNPKFSYWDAGENASGPVFTLQYRGFDCGNARALMDEEIDCAAIIESRNYLSDFSSAQVAAHNRWQATTERVGMQPSVDATHAEEHVNDDFVSGKTAAADPSYFDWFYQKDSNGPAIMTHEVEDYSRYRWKRGVDHRRVNGYSIPKRFYSPDYRRFDLPEEATVRRTLFWAPQLKTDASGRASAVFFNGMNAEVRLGVSVRGISSDGRFADWEH